MARGCILGLVAYMDDKIGRLVGALRETGQLESTLVVYTSDHGELAGDHGLWWKNSFYEQASRVPLIFSSPGGRGTIPAGARFDGAVSLLDLIRTLIDVAGAPDPGELDLDGDSLLPPLRALAGGGQRPAPAACGRARPSWSTTATPPTGPSGCSAPGAGSTLLPRRPPTVDLVADPQEFRNRAGEPEVAAVESALRRRLLADWDPQAVEAAVSDQRARQVIGPPPGPGAGRASRRPASPERSRRDSQRARPNGAPAPSLSEVSPARPFQVRTQASHALEVGWAERDARPPQPGLQVTHHHRPGPGVEEGRVRRIERAPAPGFPAGTPCASRPPAAPARPAAGAAERPAGRVRGAGWRGCGRCPPWRRPLWRWPSPARRRRRAVRQAVVALPATRTFKGWLSRRSRAVRCAGRARRRACSAPSPAPAHSIQPRCSPSSGGGRGASRWRRACAARTSSPAVASPRAGPEGRRRGAPGAQSMSSAGRPSHAPRRTTRGHRHRLPRRAHAAIFQAHADSCPARNRRRA